MMPLSEDRMRELLMPYLEDAATSHTLYAQLCAYLDLLLRWNEWTNLTAICRPEEIVQRHFGESLFLGRHLPSCTTLLDYGSGAGFPGLPIQLLLPAVKVTLAESQGKKASFLREAVRVLGLKTKIWPHRVEEMEPEQHFDVVTLRAVDKMALAIHSASQYRVAEGGTLALLITGAEGIPIPNAKNRMILFVK